MNALSAALRIFNASLLLSAHHMNAVVVDGSDDPELLLNSASKLLFMSARTSLPVSFWICWSACAISLYRSPTAFQRTVLAGGCHAVTSIDRYVKSGSRQILDLVKVATGVGVKNDADRWVYIEPLPVPNDTDTSALVLVVTVQTSCDKASTL